MNDWISSLFNNPVLDDSTIKATWLMIGLATVLSPLFKAITIGWDMVMSRINNLDGDASNKKAFHVKELARVLVLAGMLNTVYFAVFFSLNYVCNAIVRGTAPTSGGTAAGRVAFAEVIKAQINGPDWNTAAGTPVDPNAVPGGGGPEVEAKRYTGFVGPVIVDGLSVISAVIVGIIRVVIQVVSISLSKIFFAIGPLVIAFSILPVFKDKLATWFGVYLNIMLVPMMCNLFDFIIYSNVQSVTTGAGSMDPLTSLAFNLSIIILYCLAFWLTSFVVGSSSAGRVLSTGVSVVSMYGGKLLAGSKGGSTAGTAASGASGGTGGENDGGIWRKS